MWDILKGGSIFVSIIKTYCFNRSETMLFKWSTSSISVVGAVNQTGYSSKYVTFMEHYIRKSIFRCSNRQRTKQDIPNHESKPCFPMWLPLLTFIGITVLRAKLVHAISRIDSDLGIFGCSWCSRDTQYNVWEKIYILMEVNGLLVLHW